MDARRMENPCLCSCPAVRIWRHVSIMTCLYCPRCSASPQSYTARSTLEVEACGYVRLPSASNHWLAGTLSAPRSTLSTASQYILSRRNALGSTRALACALLPMLSLMRRSSASASSGSVPSLTYLASATRRRYSTNSKRSKLLASALCPTSVLAIPSDTLHAMNRESRCPCLANMLCSSANLHVVLISLKALKFSANDDPLSEVCE
mmetsp:Transcript_35248/g.86489  ORF Transcript_35248/g.86489 Transcript_35248/m.86489 type:complete len:207 (+) Transcript_35248:539-1159(+)